jgi:hypothetical protein
LAQPLAYSAGTFRTRTGFPHPDACCAVLRGDTMRLVQFGLILARRAAVRKSKSREPLSNERFVQNCEVSSPKLIAFCAPLQKFAETNLFSGNRLTFGRFVVSCQSG